MVGKAVQDYIDRLTQERRERRELEILYKNAASLNKEAADVLSYQIKQ